MRKAILALSLFAAIAVGYAKKTPAPVAAHVLVMDAKGNWVPLSITKDTEIFVIGPTGVEPGMAGPQGEDKARKMDQLLVVPPEMGMPDDQAPADPKAQKQSNPSDAKPPVTKIAPVKLPDQHTAML